jgi:hypothetical protein
MNRRSILIATASLLICLIFSPAFSQTPERRTSLTYPKREGPAEKTQTGLENDKITIPRPGGSTQDSTDEPKVRISYDRMTGITWFTSQTFGGGSMFPVLILTLYFGCTGEASLENPCAPDEVTFEARQDFTYYRSPQAFDARNRIVYILADNVRLQGAMRVSFEQKPYGTEPTSIYRGFMPVKVSALRQIVQAGNVEMRVGNMQFTLSREELDSLASLYNLAVLNRRTPATNQTPARRGKRRSGRLRGIFRKAGLWGVRKVC